MEDKAALRSRLKAARALRDRDELTRLGDLIARAGAGRARGASVVAAYAAVGDEPPTRPLLDLLVDAGSTVLLPVVTPAGLAWARYDGWAALTDRRGLLEPRDEPTAAIDDAEVVFAPALAVDRAGNRLGQGGGHYDRALAGVPRERIVAIVFSDELIDVVPAQPHDVPVGAALTPEGLVELSPPDSKV
jgi:5-formyltetrahydrofolate cyclo-ligase